MSANTERDKLAAVISQAVGGWNPATAAITNVADAILAEFMPEHDQRVKAEAWDEALVASADAFFDGDNAPIVNPYRREA